MHTPKDLQGWRNIVATVAYRGDGFAGWQRQPGQRTVEQEFRRALNKLHKCEKDVRLYASGRTDSGVHANGQVLNFYSDIGTTSLPTKRFREAINRFLPQDIQVLRCWDAGPNFHARYSARARIYQYRIIQSNSCRPQHAAWYVRKPRLDVSVLNTAVSALLGEHDFSCFTVVGDQAKSKVRHLYAASFYCSGPYIVFRVVGNAFLWHMVRSIVGTVVGLYSQLYKKLEPGTSLREQMYEQRFELYARMERYLKEPKSGHTGFNAPAHGLTLERVIYPNSPPHKLPNSFGDHWSII